MTQGAVLQTLEVAMQDPAPHPQDEDAAATFWRACRALDAAAAQLLKAEGYVIHGSDGGDVVSLPPRRYLARTEVCPGVLVSTVWLDIDLRDDDGPPKRFETMVLVDLESPVKIYRREATRDSREERYLAATEAQAVALHERLVQDLKPICQASWPGPHLSR